MELFGFYHDVDLELNWIAEHQPLAQTSSFSKSLVGAISLVKKHKVGTRLWSPGVVLGGG